MEKGLGVGAIIVAILAIFVPVVTIYVVWGALVLATMAALMGDKVSPIATVMISIVNVLFMSPMTLMALKGENESGGSMYMILTIVLAIAPIVGMVVYTNKAQGDSLEANEQ